MSSNVELKLNTKYFVHFMRLFATISLYIFFIILCIYYPLTHAAVLNEREAKNPSELIKTELFQQYSYDYNNYFCNETKLGEFKNTYYWIQTQKMKIFFSNQSLDVKIFVWTFQKSLQKVLLENKNAGKIITQTIRDNVVASNLSTNQFEVEVLNPLINKVSKNMQEKIDPPSGYNDWKSWLKMHLKVGEGNNPIAAYMNLRLSSNLDNDIHWKKNSIKLRNDIKFYLKEKDVNFFSLIQKVRSLESNKSQLEEYFADLKINQNYRGKILKYCKILYTGDFLPLTPPLSNSLRKDVDEIINSNNHKDLSHIMKISERISISNPQRSENWRMNYINFLLKSSSSRYILGIDIKGCGNINRIEHDKWIKMGASLENLITLHQTGTNFILHRKEKVNKAFKRLKIRPLARFDFGDSVFWSFSDLSEENKKILITLLEQDPDIHYLLKKINNKTGDILSVDTTVSAFTVELGSK